ncbi:cytochrome P450 [Micromonospora sp. DT201]|uniref:cytochrome P450 n=1 Tax=Micromonospora sp. DT201 TaxID=3393442 RepID=UPI003CEB7EB3
MTVVSPVPVDTVAADLDAVDLTDPATFLDNDLPELWRRFRTHSPVHRHPGKGGKPEFWVVSRYADVVAAYKDNQSFVSESGNVIDTLLYGGDSAAGKLLAVTDGARHRALRTLLLKAFTPRRLQPVVDLVRQRTRRLVARAVAAEEVDFAHEVADRIPIATICDLLGIPAEDHDRMLALTKAVLSADDDQQSADDAWEARNEILLYFAELAEHKRRHPGDDALSLLATAEVDGAPLTDEEVILNGYGLIVAGDETSRLTTIGGLRTLVDHPDQWAALREGRVTIESAVEELLRYVAPTMHFGRRAAVDTVIGGQPIAKGDIVTLWNASANLDEAVFPAPEVFDLARTPNRHVAFGFGPHFCLGAYLGRMEIAAMFESLRAAVVQVELTGTPNPIRSTLLSGFSSLPVRFTPDVAGLAALRRADD